MAELIHTDAEDPAVCRSCLAKNAGVYYKEVPGTGLCQRHKGDAALKVQKKEQALRYNIQVATQKYKTLVNDPEFKSLTQEISVLRLLLDQLLTRFGASEEDLYLNTPKIADLVDKIQRAVLSWDRIERRMGSTLDMNQAKALIEGFITIIDEECDAETTERIARRVADQVNIVQKLEKLSS